MTVRFPKAGTPFGIKYLQGNLEARVSLDRIRPKRVQDRDTFSGQVGSGVKFQYSLGQGNFSQGCLVNCLENFRDEVDLNASHS